MVDSISSFIAAFSSKESVPGGVGSVTTSVLLKHTLLCAEKLAEVACAV